MAIQSKIEAFGMQAPQGYSRITQIQIEPQRAMLQVQSWASQAAAQRIAGGLSIPGMAAQTEEPPISGFVFELRGELLGQLLSFSVAGGGQDDNLLAQAYRLLMASDRFLDSQAV